MSATPNTTTTVPSTPLPHRRWGGLVLALALLLLALAVAPFVGYTALDYGRVFDGSIPLAENRDRLIFIELRFSRAVFAALVGGCLGMAGAVFQVAMRNDLATPYTLGVSGGATLGALLCIQFGLVGAATALGGMAGGLAAVGLVLYLAHRLPARGGTATLLLAGVTMNLLFGSMVLVIQYFADPYEVFQMMRWLMGGVDVVGLGVSLRLAPFLALLGGLVLTQAHALNLLALDDQTARSLGVVPDRARLMLLGATSLMVALVVSFSGPIGFIGLIVPHGVRRLVGGDNRLVLPGSALVGGAFLVVADVVGRVAGGQLSVPVGVVTTLLGAPVFLAMLMRRG